MNKRLTLLMTAMMLLFTNAFTALGQTQYQKVTSAPTDWSGDYLLVWEKSADSAYVWTGVDAASCYSYSPIANGKITAAQSISITIATMEGGYSIKVNGGTNNGKYIYGTSGSNKINFGTTAKLNTLSYENSSVKIESFTSVMRFNKASSDKRFRYYKAASYSNQQPVQLYKKIGGNEVATPAFTPTGGTYYATQNVTITCATNGATIYYTTDGTAPTTSSAVYSSPITVSTTTTIKALGVKSGMENSEVATATYTLPTLVTIAEARALENNQYALVEGVVTLIDGTSVYVQDETAGIDLFLNTGTVPGTLALGDKVKAYGKKTVYKGLVELTGIDGSNASVFSIVSSGNELPLAVKTVAEINANGLSSLQSQRVKIEGGILGTINTSGNTTLTQNGNVVNIYKIPALQGIVAGDSVSVISVIGCYNAVQLRVAFASDVVKLGGTETVETPTFSPAGGNYTEAQTVSISCGTTGATIRYTLDGSDPTESSTAYSTPLNVSSTTTIKAKAWKTGFDASAIASATYTITLPQEFNQIYSHAAVVDGGTYMIVDVNSGKALTSANGASSSPTAVAVEINNGKIITANTNLQWTVKATEGGYVIHPLGSTTSWLYSTNNNNGVRVGTNTDSIWTLNVNDGTPEGYYGMKHNATARYLGVYNNQDWRAYNSINNNIKETEIQFFVLGDAPVIPDPVLTLTPNQLQMSYTYTLGPSAIQSLAIAGNYLAEDVVLTATEPFEISIHPDSTFASSLSIEPVRYALTSTNVYVRLKAGQNVGTYAGTLAASCSGHNFNATLSGVVSEMDVVDTPTFTPEGGSYLTSQMVAISCDTVGVTIYYTLDGTDPTTESNVYSSPIAVSTTKTIKAMAVKAGLTNSLVATATYTIPTLINIAEARMLENNEYALVEGIVTFIDGRSIYIQDGTAGIDLFLNNGTVPDTIALGDEVRVYGKKTVYNGLVELTGINGGSASQFIIESTGNDLPNEVKTIADINADFSGDNMLQSTRVTIETAILRSLNASGISIINQDGSTLNVYRIPVPEGMIVSDWVTITGVISCNQNTPQLRVASIDDVEFAHRPTIVATPSTISGLTYEYEEGPSEIASVTISANYLLDDVFIAPSESFELSTSDESSFNPENPVRIIPPHSGHIYGVKVYCRLKAGLEPGTYNELQTAYTQDGDTVSIRLIGSVTGGVPPTPPTGEEYVRISEVSQLTDGCEVVLAARYNSNVSSYVAIKTITDNGKMPSTEFTSATSGSSEILPSSIVDTIANYNWTVNITNDGYTFTNANGDVVSYNSGTNFNFNGDKDDWTIEICSSDTTTLVPRYQGFVIKNVATNTRAFAINSNYHSCGAYSTNNMSGSNASGYNFLLDIFMKGEIDTLTVNTPTFDPVAGTYYEAQDVTIACATEGATIHYTLDGSDPTADSPVYSEALTIAATTTVKAIAMKEGYDDSAIAEATYTIVADPVINTSVTTLDGFFYYENNGPSAEQSFTVSGLNLTNDINIAGAENFEMSLFSGDDFEAQTTINLVQTSGTVEETTIYVRMMEGLGIGDYEGDITLSTNGATPVTIACSGTVLEEGGQGGNYVRIVDAGELVAGNRVILAARYNATATNYVAFDNVLTSGKLNSTEFVSTTEEEDEIVPTEILLAEANYYWTVGVTDNGYTFTNPNGDVIGYGASGTNFALNSDKTEWIVATATSDTNTMVPSYFGFNIINYTTTSRAFALNTNHVGGAYSTSNMTGSNAGTYNFYLDIFMQGEGGTPSVATPTFTPAAGTYFEAQQVSINCATSDADIYYSLESESGPWEAYTDAITVDEDMTIWAYAEKEDYNNSLVASASYVINDDVIIIFNQDWENDWNGWTEVSVEGETAEWTIAEHSGNHYAYLNGYNQGINEDWLISPAFDLDSHTDAVLSFRSAMNYTGPDVEVYFSNDYDGQDPTTATWQALNCDLSQGGWEWTESGEIALDEFGGNNCYIAFKYTCTDTEAAGWEIDDILLTSGITTDPTLIVTPNSIYGLTYIEGEGPSAAQTYNLSAANLEGEGEVMILVTEGFEISIDDEVYGDELEVAYADGQIVDQPVTIYVRLAEGLEIGTYEGVIMHEGGNAYNEVNLAGEVITADQPYIDAFMPMYIQGNNGSNNNRVPVAIAVYLENLEANTTYRYVNQFVDGNDGPETNGAGNIIFADPDGFYRTTNPSLSTEGNYGEFTTDETGEAFIWCINESTANTRFTPGNQVYLRIRINDGHDGTTTDQIFTTEDAATVLNFGTENDEFSGSSFYAKSEESPMTFAMMFATDDDWRPTYSTSIETTGVDYANINQYANFYKEEVASKDGYFGGILPNNNENGINIIWILDMESYVINDYYTENGMWNETNTVNPNNGVNDPMFIDLTYDGVNEGETSEIKIWSADNEIRIDNPDGGRFIMNVTNILGQTVMSQSVNGQGLIRVNHNLTSGLYIVTLLNNNTKLSAKIIVK